MTELITVDTLLKEAKKKGIDFGKGDPYNRLRYYTKIGWIPHMVRKKGDRGFTKGHYPKSTVDRLLLIQKYKEQGMSNEDIEQKLKVKDRVTNLYSSLRSEAVRKRVIAYATLALVAIILISELGVIRIGKPKRNQIIIQSGQQAQIQIMDSGTAFVPVENNKIFVRSESVFENAKIYVSFKDDYSPATRFWVSNQRAGDGFTVELDAPIEKNAEFDWWITN